MSRPPKRKMVPRAKASAKPVQSPIALVVVEDNPLLRTGLAALIQSQPGFTVLAAAADGDAGLEKVREAKPDVVLLDLGLADQDSLALTGRVRGEVPAAKVIIMGLLPAQEDVADYVEAGASGFIMKDASFDEFLSTIRAVAHGVEVLPEALTNSLFTQIVRRAALEPKTNVVGALRMTGSECEIISLIGEGRTNTEIAAQLDIGAAEVKSAVHNVMEKLVLLGQLDLGVLADAGDQGTMGDSVLPEASSSRP